jgi:hypothetical protein
MVARDAKKPSEHVVTIDEHGHVIATIGVVAAVLGVTKEWARQLVKRADADVGRNAKDLSAVVEHMISEAAGDEDPQERRSSQMERYRGMRADLMELELKHRKGEFVFTKDEIASQIQIAALVRRKMHAVVGEATPRLAGQVLKPRESNKILMDLFTKAMNDIASATVRKKEYAAVVAAVTELLYDDEGNFLEKPKGMVA